MHLKSCCALFLLALVACQAAPSTTIETKSISEPTNVNKENIDIKEFGAEKDRAKKATTFCIEVRDGQQQTVPCEGKKQPIVMVQPELPKPTLVHQPALVEYPIQFAEAHVPQAPQPVQVIHVQPQPAPTQIVHVPQPAPVAQVPQPIQIAQIPQPAPVAQVPQQIQIAQIPQPAPVAQVPQPIQIAQIPQPAPVAQLPQSVQTIQFQPIAQPLPQPAPQPITVVQPAPAPAVQPLQPQAPIVNILTPPAAPCNAVPTPTEHKPEPVKEVEQPIFRPQLEPELRPRPIAMPSVEVMQPVVVEPTPCNQEVHYLPNKPMVLPEKYVTLKVADLEQPRPVSEPQCICKQNPSWLRHHHKVHEHHVTIHPSANSPSAAPVVLQSSCPYANYMSNSRPTYGTYAEAAPYGNTIISLNPQYPQPYYSYAQSNLQPLTSYPGYPTYPTSNPRPYAPSVTVNAFPTGNYRQSQTSSQLLAEKKESTEQHPIGTATSIPAGTAKQEADSAIKNSQRTNIAPEQAKYSVTPVKVMYAN